MYWKNIATWPCRASGFKLDTLNIYFIQNKYSRFLFYNYCLLTAYETFVTKIIRYEFNYYQFRTGP